MFVMPYVASFLRNREARWPQHFDFARAASAYKVQYLGDEGGRPSQDDIAEMRRLYANGAA